MAGSRPTEGVAVFSHPSLSSPAQTWYQIYGPLDSSTHPIVTLHGGPGAGHVYLSDLQRLSTAHNQTVIFYDQIGGGKSTHLRERRLDHSFWTVELFTAELNNLIAHLNITNFTLLGHSWGGVLGAEYAITQNQDDASRGLKRLIISNSPASMEMWVTSCNELRAFFPDRLDKALTRYEEAKDYTNPEYLNAVIEFYKRHMCRVPNPNGVDPFPDQVMAMMQSIEDDDTVYFTMNGPSEFTVIGNLKDWSAIGRLDAIRVPTLVVNGEFDEASSTCVEPFAREIPGAEWKTLEGTSHCGFVEEPEKYCEMVMEWLGRHPV